MNEKSTILLIAPVFFGYYKEIIAELEHNGFLVDFFADIPSSGNLSKAVGRINRRLLMYSTWRYYYDKIRPTISTKHYDALLVVGGMTFSFPDDVMREIVSHCKDARARILYLWDSVDNLGYVQEIRDCFDHIFTFDRSDALREDFKLSFLPLFYTRIYEGVKDMSNSDLKYDCSYVGTAHPLKFKNINDMSDALKPVMPRQFIYHYMPSRLKFWYQKLTAKEFREAKMVQLETEKLSQNKLIELIEQSRCVLDSPQSGQTGLTMRVFEVLGARRKLITTNKDIVNYDFYRPENILVWNGNVDLNNVFFTNEYKPLPADIYEKYALRNWLKKMLQ